MKRILLAMALLYATTLDAAAQSQPYIGQIMIFAGNFCPIDWAPTRGQILPISENTTLFNLIGTTYGGNGTTTFALPNTLPVDAQGAVPFTECIALFGVYPSQN